MADANDAIVLVGSRYVFKHYYKQGLPIFILSKELINDRVALVNRLEELSKDHDHLWLVSIRPWRVDPKGVVPAMLNDRYTAVGRQELTGVEVYSYQLR